MRKAVQEWLAYEDARSEGETALVAYLSERETRGLGKPSMPSPLVDARRMRRMNFTHMMYDGGIYNQPYMWYREVHAALDEEDEFFAAKRATQAMKQRNEQMNSRPIET